MKSWIVFALVAVLSLPAAARCVSTPGKSVPETQLSPEDVIEKLWKVAAEGELLTPKDWDRAVRGFASDYPIPSPGDTMKRVFTNPPSPLLVTSNGWGILFCRIEGNSAEVVMEYVDNGRIDSKMRYSPGKDFGPMGKTALVYKLIFAPSHYPTYVGEGNVLKVDRIMTGPAAWQLAKTPPLPWTTVNTAIRYVLETREKTHDPVIRANATKTLAQLLKLH
jgi:hypothetical protein